MQSNKINTGGTYTVKLTPEVTGWPWTLTATATVTDTKVERERFDERAGRVTGSRLILRLPSADNGVVIEWEEQTATYWERRRPSDPKVKKEYILLANSAVVTPAAILKEVVPSDR